MTTLTGQDIGRAHHATRAVLERHLDAAGIGFTTWIVLNAIGSSPSEPTADDLVALVTNGLKIKDDEARAILQQAVGTGLAEPASPVRTSPSGTTRVRLTEAGSVVFHRMTATIAEITERLYGGLDADDLAVTRRVLGIVTARADSDPG